MFAFPDETTLEDILTLMKYERELELTINWKSNAKAQLKLAESPVFRKINLNAPSSLPSAKEQRGGLPAFSMNQRNVNIYDCLSCFGQEETLAGNDKWYCSKCKEHVPALKKIEIYSTPEFLVVHFKRFSHQRNSMFGSRKLNAQIDFPVCGLDMTGYLVKPQAEGGSTAPGQGRADADDCALPSPEAGKDPVDVDNKIDQGRVFPGKIQDKQYIYDLYAVSNHYGSLNGGHYTAFCQNPIARKWFEFDDTHVTKVSPKNNLDEIERAVVGKAAYVLFYRLRREKRAKPASARPQGD
jgi:ubiquitin carboxyl-terminal hydrolase 4/11/15